MNLSKINEFPKELDAAYIFLIIPTKEHVDM
jgi:hypothetical protein